MVSTDTDSEDFRVLQSYSDIRALVEQEVFDALAEPGYNEYASEIANKVANGVCNHLDAA